MRMIGGCGEGRRTSSAGRALRARCLSTWQRPHSQRDGSWAVLAAHFRWIDVEAEGPTLISLKRIRTREDMESITD